MPKVSVKVVAFYVDRPYVVGYGNMYELLTRIYTDSDLCCFTSLYVRSRPFKYRVIRKTNTVESIVF